MLWFVTLAFLVLAILGFFITRRAYPIDRGFRNARYCIVGFFLLLFLLVTGTRSLNIVDNGHVGLVYTFGSITGQRGDGLIVVAPWQNVAEVNVQTQSVVPESICNDGARDIGNCLAVFTSENQDSFIQTRANVKISPDHVQQLYREVGPDYIGKLVRPRIQQITKEETVKYTATELAPNREQLRKNIATRLRDELAVYSITVEDFYIENISFTIGFQASIENNVIAERNLQTETTNVKIEEQKANQQKQKGIAEGNYQYELAVKQAAANEALSASLSPELIQYTAIQKLSPNISVVGIPIGQGTIFDVGTLLTPEQTPTPTP